MLSPLAPRDVAPRRNAQLCRQPEAKLKKSNGSRHLGIKKVDIKSVSTQAVLAVARRCKECGVHLSATESMHHRCALALAWPFPAPEGFAAEGIRMGRGVTSCRIVRLDSRLFSSPTGRRQFEALWSFISVDLPHALGEPTIEAIASGTALLLLAVQAKEVVGLIWIEVGHTTAYLEDIEVQAETEHGTACAGDENITLLPSSRRDLDDAVSVVLIWVRKSMRRHGIATALLDIARECAAAPRLPRREIPRDAVAFSQPTRQGLAFARQYQRAELGGKAQLLQADWMPQFGTPSV
mmetsp:Transcript_60403/g.143998  ORF Transcript_60403/g.143998 Transcript_60403/m.143998 type:complete len:295 (-) Transcript_60403:231-1115(-)